MLFLAEVTQCFELASPLILTANLFFEPSKHTIFQGMLMDIPMGRIEGGQERELNTPICFVSCGKFELRAEIHIFDASQDEGVVGKGQLIVIVKDW
jgi:trafficking protein particle complex subunit 9